MRYLIRASHIPSAEGVFVEQPGACPPQTAAQYSELSLNIRADVFAVLEVRAPRTSPDED